MADDTQARPPVDPYLALARADFFGDTEATKARVRDEALRSRTPAQRAHAKTRTPRTRTEFVGFRTTPGTKRLIEALQKRAGGSVTDVLEEAVRSLAVRENIEGDI